MIILSFFSDSSDDEYDVFLPNISNTSIAGELEAKIK